MKTICLFVCSFSAARRESISQWQRYGSDGTGYCIGFDPRKLNKVFAKDEVSLEAMVYDLNTQRTIASEALRCGLSKYHDDMQKMQEDKLDIYAVIYFDTEIEQAKLRLKNPAFRDEEEWRYFKTEIDWSEFGEDSGHGEQFSVRGLYVKPFLALPSGEEPSRLPIVRVICGPKLDAELAVSTARRFLEVHGYEVPVETSALATTWR